MNCLAIKNFHMEFFTTPNPKNKIATLRIVTVEKPERICCSIFLFEIMLCFSLRKCFPRGIPSPSNICSKSAIEH